MPIIALITGTAPIQQLLEYLGEPTQPPCIPHPPARFPSDWGGSLHAKARRSLGANAQLLQVNRKCLPA